MRNSYVISVVAVIAAFSIISCKSANRAASNAAAEWKDIVAWKGDVSLNQKVLPAPLFLRSDTGVFCTIEKALRSNLRRLLIRHKEISHFSL